VCKDALVVGRVVEVFPVSHLAPQEPWFACSRPADADRRAVSALLAALQAPRAPTAPP